MPEKLIALGRAEVSIGSQPSEQVLGHAHFMDDGGLHVMIEGADGDPVNDTMITFPPSAIDDAVRKWLKR